MIGKLTERKISTSEQINKKYNAAVEKRINEELWWHLPQVGCLATVSCHSTSLSPVRLCSCYRLSNRGNENAQTLKNRN